MNHKISVNTEEFLKALKGASFYVSKDSSYSGIDYVLLELSQKILSVIACDGKGYYESRMQVCNEKCNKPSLPGKPMRLLIPAKEATAITKNIKCKGIMTLEAQDAQNGIYQVKLSFPDAAAFNFASPEKVDLPDYGKIRKLAEKGKKDTVNIGQLQLPVQELTRAGKVFPVKAGYTIPMYVAKWKNGGLITLLEYQSETEHADIKVIFALGLSEAA